MYSGFCADRIAIHFLPEESRGPSGPRIITEPTHCHRIVGATFIAALYTGQVSKNLVRSLARFNPKWIRNGLNPRSYPNLGPFFVDRLHQIRAEQKSTEF